MRESDFQAQVVAIAERFGWQVWHVPAPMRWSPKEQKFVPAREGAGLPDLILIHDAPPRLVVMELKGEGGKLSPRQQDFLQAAKEVAETTQDWHRPEPVIGVFAFWPDDIGRVEQMLRSCVVA